MNFKPLSDNVLIKALKEDKTESGIFLSEKNETPEQGEVIAVGPGKKKELPVQPGDTVIFSKFGVNKIKIENVEYLIVSITDILGIIK